jgi:glycosyltransferase involved in cell wall biosynthesis
MASVSIILPTYNRARFLPQAFRSIGEQTWADWEVLVVDDGSTDETAAVVAELSARTRNPVRYLRQDNQGPAGARNTGLDAARGDYIAFFDSDDYWLPHHLHACVTALEAHAEIDWAYGACRMVEHASGRVLMDSTFYEEGRPRPFLRLRTRPAGPLRIIDDPGAVPCMITHGLYCGLQCSVLRRRVCERLRFPPYRVGEDLVFIVQALKADHRFAYFDDVHTLYHAHGENISAAAAGSLEKQLRAYEDITRGFASLPERVALTRAERRALNVRLSREYFWHLGYNLLWQHGRRQEALKRFWQGLRLRPWNLVLWKTYLLARVRTLLAGPGPSASPPAAGRCALRS